MKFWQMLGQMFFSEHLLEVAKKAVEIAIEENEEEATAYITKQFCTLFK